MHEQVGFRKKGQNRRTLINILYTCTTYMTEEITIAVWIPPVQQNSSVFCGHVPGSGHTPDNYITSHGFCWAYTEYFRLVSSPMV
jgi:hypothetical protein